mgnify:CR=1 FL=1
MRLSVLLQSAVAAGASSRLEIPPSWAQGRTTYGGLTAAICAAEAERQFPGLPAMRSAQIAFVGPAGGEVEARAEMLRQGKSSAFVEVTLHGAHGIVSRGVFVYGIARESALRMTDMPMPDVPGPGEARPISRSPARPRFLENFEIRLAGGAAPFSGSDESRMLWWARHTDAAMRDSAIGLLAAGDVTPPAAASFLEEVVPVASVNWQMDVLTDRLDTDDGWLLLSTRAQSAADGWSAQDMRMWTELGQPVAAGRQTTVLFG